MIFVLPIVLGVAAASASVFGLAKGAEGFSNIKKAEEMGKHAQRLHERYVGELEVYCQDAKKLAELYGKLNLRVRQRVIGRFTDFIKSTGRKMAQSEQQFLEGIKGGVTIQELQEFKTLVFEAEEILKTLAEAGGVGCVAGSGAVGVAGAVGTVAVPQFFGLFAKQVAVTELGLSGVALWFGGGNALLGGAVLGGIALGPALAVGGFKLASKGEEALTEAKAYQAKVNESIEKIKGARSFLGMLEKRIRELGILVRKLESLTSACLDELENKEFDPIKDASKFQRAYFLVKALIEILKTPILDNQGDLNPEVITIQEKYRNLGDL